MSVQISLTFSTMSEALAFLSQRQSVPYSADAALSQTVHAAIADNISTSPASTVGTPNVAPPAPSAPIVAPQSASPVGNVEFDASGLPWDERIHSGAKTRTEKGLWRTKKGVADSLVAQVEFELRSRSMPNAGVAVAPPAPAAPPAPPVVNTVPPATPGMEKNFANLLKVNAQTSLANGQAETQTRLQGVLAQLSVNNMIELASKPELIPHVWAAMGYSE